MNGDVNILIDGISLDEFLIAHPIARADILRKYVVQVTRLFNKRLQVFIKTILLANFENSLPVEFYSYRIEMQLRGMAHANGCLWLKQSFMDDYKDGQMLADDKLSSLVDQFVTCSLPAEDDPMRQKVLQLQVHHHTKSCLKKRNCQFNFPRVPSQKTLIAKPVSTNSSEEKMKKYLKILSEAKQVLLSDSPPKNFPEFFQMLSVTPEDYYEALSVSHF